MMMKELEVNKKKENFDPKKKGKIKEKGKKRDHKWPTANNKSQLPRSIHGFLGFRSRSFLIAWNQNPIIDSPIDQVK